MYGVTRTDRVKNSRIPDGLPVRDIADKLQKSHLRWFDHVLRHSPSYVENKCLAMLRPPGPGRRNRPEKCWLDVVKGDIRANGLLAKVPKTGNVEKKK